MSRSILPDNVGHEILELLVSNLAWSSTLNLGEHLLQLIVFQMLTFSTEALLKIGFSDISTVINVEVMESESHVGVCDGLSAVDCHGEELSVVDLTIMVEVDALKDRIQFFFSHVQTIEGSSDFAQLKGTRVVSVHSSECITEFTEIESFCVRLID